MIDISLLGQSRSEIIKTLNETKEFDLLIVGGGIHGAVAARLAAQSGLKVLLLEQGDYAQGTSSRSSKMAHGGLRYLELLDFEQVFEGVKCRDLLYQSYPDFVRPHPFLIPVPKSDWFFRLKLGVGLMLYDLMLKDKQQAHVWLNDRKVLELVPELSTKQLAGCYRYSDGLMNDSQLVLLNILQARVAGAICLNYFRVDKLDSINEKCIVANCCDVAGNQQQQVFAKAVLNCSGPWVGSFCKPALKFSRGSHILFSREWNRPALFMPMAGKARYYFIWPHPAGTLVGTTEREVGEAELDPLPAKDEIDEILANLEKDLPQAGLNRSSAHYAFAGIRSLALRGAKLNSARLSRKHIWLQDRPGIFSLLGGKLTTAEWTAKEGLKLVAKYLGHQVHHNQTAINLKFNLGTTDVATAFKQQQAVTLEDFMRRRTLYEYQPGHGLDRLPELQAQLELFISSELLAEQIGEYHMRMGRIDNLFI